MYVIMLLFLFYCITVSCAVKSMGIYTSTSAFQGMKGKVAVALGIVLWLEFVIT